MSYTEEEIKKYLAILHNYKVEREGSPMERRPQNYNVQIAQILNFLHLFWPTKSVMNVVQQTVMY